MTNQQDRHQDVRDQSNTAFTFNGDWLAFFDSLNVAAGTFGERMLLWLNSENGVTDQSLVVAKQRYATSKGVLNWNSLAAITVSPGSGVDNILDELGFAILNETGGAILAE